MFSYHTAMQHHLIINLLLCFLVAFTSGQTFKKRIQPTEWTWFTQVHNKQYATVTEEQYRQAIFQENFAMINRHNLEAEMGLHSYILKINQFADMTHDEFVQKMLSGLNTELAASTSNNFDRHTYRPPAITPLNLPAAVDWRKVGAVTPVGNQQQCGSCWAFTAVGALEGQHFIKTGKLVALSAQNLVDCSDKYGNMGCNGGLMDASFQYIKDNKGLDTEASYPYEGQDGKCRFKRENVGATDTGFVDLQQGNETELQIAIATVGPISTAMDASHSSFQFYSSGVYDEPACTTSLDHTLVLVGYGTATNGTKKQEYYIGKNSWGETWGLDGYIWMSRNKNNQCGIANMASYPLV